MFSLFAGGVNSANIMRNFLPSEAFHPPPPTPNLTPSEKIAEPTLSLPLRLGVAVWAWVAVGFLVGVGVRVDVAVTVNVAVDVLVGRWVSVAVKEGMAVAVGSNVGVAGACADLQAVKMRNVVRAKILHTRIFISTSFGKAEALNSEMDKIFFFSNLIVTY